MQKQISPYLTPSIVALLLTNLIILAQAIVMDWGAGTMIWTYWMQGLVIVLIALVVAKQRSQWIFLLALLAFYALFLLALTFPSDSASYTINGRPVTADRFTVLKDVMWPAVWFNTLVLSVNHMFSYLTDRKNSAQSRTFSKVIYRIMPLHIIIVLAATVPFPVVVFMIIKTFADLKAHAVQHAGPRWASKKATV